MWNEEVFCGVETFESKANNLKKCKKCNRGTGFVSEWKRPKKWGDFFFRKTGKEMFDFLNKYYTFAVYKIWDS